MRVDVKFDTRALKVRTAREAKRLAFNTAQAINETLKEIQVEERINLERKFTLRKTTFIHRLVKILRFASARKGVAFGEIGIDPKKKRVLLGLFEKGGTRPAFKGKRVAVPITGGPARPTFRESIRPAFRFTALRLRRPRKRRGAGASRRLGQQQTFQIPRVGVFQRIGEKVRPVYLFIRGPQLDKGLNFIRIARRVINREWPKQFARAYRKPA